MRLSSKDPATMTPGQINKEVEKIEDAGSKINREMLAAGRGNERYSDTQAILDGPNPDPLTVEWGRIESRRLMLKQEIRSRAGPNYYMDLQRIHKRRR